MADENRLAKETSPYLLQHRTNPVDWYPWGDEALARAKREDKPIFLSVGYSACHWCHVMEHESFEDPRVGAFLAEHFVSIKVDREERPDVDEIYMKAVQALTGRGGWPMSVWLTPELEPFYGGTYFPPARRHGLPSFMDVLTAIATAWEKDRARLREQGTKLADAIRREAAADTRGALGEDVLDLSLAALLRSFDPEWGGFGDAPKFPHAMDIAMCLAHHARTKDEKALHVATHTLARMANGGIHDQLGGGFHRYSVDERWLIPHFEKMLYDNALLAPVYVDASLVTGDARFADVARSTCRWMLREMRTSEGGFASSQDADSEGEEGRFFVWTPSQLVEVLGPVAGARAAAFFDVTEHGNFEHGTSALWRPRPLDEVASELRVPPADLAREMEDARAKLFAVREKRVKPGTDDKVLVSWNGLAIAALARVGHVLGEAEFVDAARGAARYILGSMRKSDGKLFATARAGRAHLDATLDDYVFLIHGLLALYQADGDEAWVRESLALERIVAEEFEDRERGGFFTTGASHEKLIVRLKNPQDGALPSGVGVHLVNLARLGALTGRAELLTRADRAIASVAGLVTRYPSAFSQILLGVEHLRSPREVVLSGEPGAAGLLALEEVVRRRYLPRTTIAHARATSDTALLTLLEGRLPEEGRARAFVCLERACGLPATTAAELERQLDA